MPFCVIDHIPIVLRILYRENAQRKLPVYGIYFSVKPNTLRNLHGFFRHTAGKRSALSLAQICLVSINES